MTKKGSLVILYSIVFALLSACGEPSQQSDNVELAKTVSVDSTSAAKTEPTEVNLPTAEQAETLYNRSCISCHSSGIANAPKSHDLAAWQPRLEKGMSTLLENTKRGINAMPPMGMCTQCSDQDFEALIVYMSSKKQ